MLGAAIVVGVVVGGVAWITGTSLCSAGHEGVACAQLTRTLALRVGLVAGATTALMLLLVAGLLRMLAQEDRDRAERAMEEHLDSLSERPEGR